MDNGLNTLLESGLLNEETKNALEEAWNVKIQEAKDSIREEIEKEVRQDCIESFELEKTSLIEAMNAMLTDAVEQYTAESVQATKDLMAERARLTASVKEARAEYKARTAQHMKMLEQFFVARAASELSGLVEDQKAIKALRVRLAREISEAKKNYNTRLAEEVSKLENAVSSQLRETVEELVAEKNELAKFKVEEARQLRSHKIAINEESATRINKLENFVLEQLNKELREFNEDKKALDEARVRLISESRSKLDETKKAFIARASKLVESTFEKQMKLELTQLKEDIQEARKNMLGRSIYEAFKGEFMTTHFNEKAEISTLQKQLDESTNALKQVKSLLEEKNSSIQAMARKAKLAEERASRIQIKNELLAPLSKDKRNVMEDLLESVKTEKLKETFQKYLPTVLQEGMRNATQGRRVLSETAPEPKTVAITGNRVNPLAESARADNVNAIDEIAELRRLAGIDE